jgi:hypothetical protein
MRPLPLRPSFAVAALLALSGCTGGMGAVVQSLREVLPGSSRADTAKLDPKFEYLRVTRGKQVAMLYRGTAEQSPAGRIDLYYSGLGEILRIQNGRIVGALGLTTEWRRVDVLAPQWRAAAAEAAGVRVIRTRDVMPGYVSDLREELVLRRVAVPSSSALTAVDAGALTWFEERVSATQAAASQALPPARYAVDLAKGGGTVVYAEQCLAPDLCFSWQRWSAAMQRASTP